MTTFIAAGFHQPSVLLHTGRLGRPDLLIALAAGGVAAVLYFVAIIITSRPAPSTFR